VEYDHQNPPDIYFDTNVWIGMNDNDAALLERLERKRRFLYRYSITNYCELLSHFEDLPSASCTNPFAKYQSCFRKIIGLCDAEVLPSPEMEFLILARLEKYLDAAWIPNFRQTAIGVEVAANAQNLAELTGYPEEENRLGNVPRYVIKPSHYRRLRDTDGESFTRIMQILKEVSPPIKGFHKQKLDKLFIWFMNLAQFFFLVRPSNGRVSYDVLDPEEKERFAKAFYDDGGKLFHIHCVQIAKTTINDRRNVYPNDLYDAMQLLHLKDKNRLFVTDDGFFYRYKIDPEIQRVLPWSAFKSSE